ncbi:hypothetical protein ElyMa_006435700 [Elysia marginata]|uniref:Uncharacterized protein n=1 Tax=Elysia marginata TaxID=1093978 RepID=A0AAV4HUZ5_9GAST|nr:hypothetical protein ElyMa_006435700 [Elysia marginata]
MARSDVTDDVIAEWSLRPCDTAVYNLLERPSGKVGETELVSRHTPKLYCAIVQYSVDQSTYVEFSSYQNLQEKQWSFSGITSYQARKSDSNVDSCRLLLQSTRL